MKHLTLGLALVAGIVACGLAMGTSGADIFMRCYFTSVGVLACAVAKWSKLL